MNSMIDAFNMVLWALSSNHFSIAWQPSDWLWVPKHIINTYCLHTLTNHIIRIINERWTYAFGLRQFMSFQININTRMGHSVCSILYCFSNICTTFTFKILYAKRVTQFQLLNMMTWWRIKKYVWNGKPEKNQNNRAHVFMI